ncbi:tripartite-type tricarboxylate transporter receptor subunit TctC [Humitalea rosea]|uniref:Tripartite-type tricarboxylate transporter receptor subunit TctC n=1 Tax=Humitalea rosea TaxID=990373 RepID=A0A2W7IHU2_9PROT|nr:tripartite tricarboxylate transporter substrate binding protein [Humitalea rosea]PZW38887.1 tripartite-type tricarboxylate transporter receptor subunit TctC [Humitalea rosea]
MHIGQGGTCRPLASDRRREGSQNHPHAGLAARRIRALLAAALAFVGLGGPAQAQPASANYPDRFVRLIVPYPPGGSVDPVARLLSEKLTERWGQRVVIDNRPGAGTIIGTEVVARAPRDGYTLLLTASTHVTNALLFSNLPYDSVRDFTPVATVYKSEFVLVAHPAVPATTLQELIAYARANPNRLNYASAGAGNASHIAGEVFSRMAGVQMTHVPYRGGGPLTTDLLRGDVQLYFAVPVAVLPPIQTGRLRALATTADTRLSILPDVPTFAEAGMPGFGIRSWIGLYAPAGTPEAIVNRISADMASILAMADVRERLESQGQIPFISAPLAMTALMEEDSERFARAIREANIQIAP